MHITFWIAFVPITLVSLMFGFPKKAKTVVAELKRRWRLYLIQKYGELEADLIAEEFKKKYLKEGFSEEMIDEVLERNRQKIITKFGTKAANEKLGEPTPLERYH